MFFARPLHIHAPKILVRDIVQLYILNLPKKRWWQNLPKKRKGSNPKIERMKQ